MVCDVTLVCVHVHIVILRRELALPAGRMRSRNTGSMYLIFFIRVFLEMKWNQTKI